MAERKNRHLLEVARSLMYTMNVPKFFWSEAVMTATHLINRIPSRVLGMKTPCEMIFGKKMSLLFHRRCLDAHALLGIVDCLLGN